MAVEVKLDSTGLGTRSGLKDFLLSLDCGSAIASDWRVLESEW